MKYKLPAILLTLFLVLSLVPAAFAADGDGTVDYCIEGADPHPVAESIVETYGVFTVEDIMVWYCEGYDFGQIMMALETYTILAEQDPTIVPLDTVDQLLTDWTELGCWSLVWQEYDLAARLKGAAQKNIGASDEPGPEQYRAGNGNLGIELPEYWAGPRDDVNPPPTRMYKGSADMPGPGPAEFKGQPTVEPEPTEEPAP